MDAPGKGTQSNLEREARSRRLLQPESFKQKPRGQAELAKQSLCVSVCAFVFEEGAPSKPRQWQCAKLKTRRKHGAWDHQNLTWLESGEEAGAVKGGPF